MAQRWTVVQHSGFGYSGDPQFEKGLEPRAVATAAQQKAVEKAGGLLFDDWPAAEEFADRAMYPLGSGWLIPSARGSFADLKVDQLAVYVPVRQVVG